MDYQKILNEIKKEVRPLLQKGKVADYIPALAGIPHKKFGMAVTLVNGESYETGDSREEFSVQSISKVLTLTIAMERGGDKIWRRVGREPSGNPFNSLVQLEHEHGKPRNPFINAGALVINDIIMESISNPSDELLRFVRILSGNPKIKYDTEVAMSEKNTGFRNVALINFIKSFGKISNDPGKILDFYYHQCALRMNCYDLSRTFLYLANEGVNPLTGKRVISKRQAKRMNALMLTCGTYDAVGEFAYWVGLPGKSGIGGGIIAIIPKVMSIAVWSPGLNKSGNSLAGTKALELFTTKTGISVF